MEMDDTRGFLLTARIRLEMMTGRTKTENIVSKVSL